MAAIHRGMDHDRFPPVVFLDPLLDKSGIRNELVDPLARSHIPDPQVIRKGGDQEVLQPSPRIREIVVMHVPDISHRRVAVGDMEAAGHGKNSLGHAMTGAENQIVAAEIESFNGGREEREIISIIGRNLRQSLNKGGLDPHSFNHPGQTVLDIKERIEVGLRIELTEHFKNPLASSHPGQPVMDKSNSHPFPSSSRK
jgi:hypothetical protein